MEDWVFVFLAALASVFYAGVWIENRIWRHRVSAHATSLMTEVIRICPEMTKVVFHRISRPEFDARVQPDADLDPAGDIPAARVAEDPRAR